MIHEEEDTIYERMGGADTVKKLIYSFYNKVLDDPVLAPFFEHVPMDKLRNMQEEFFTAATGGPVVYTGRPLSEVHRGFKIRLAQFQRFTEHLLETLKEVGVGDDDANEIIGQVNLMIGDVTGEHGYDSE